MKPDERDMLLKAIKDKKCVTIKKQHDLKKEAGIKTNVDYNDSTKVNHDYFTFLEN
jgi:hypothetical protein